MTDNTNKNNSIGYWASQEQYSMQDLLKFVSEAESGGFNSCLAKRRETPEQCRENKSSANEQFSHNVVMRELFKLSL